jgi:hypothetical protein
MPNIPNLDLGGAASDLNTATKVINRRMISAEKLLGVV